MPAFLDLETYSAEPIKNGTFRYAENAEILMCAWAVDDAEPEIWDAKREKYMPPALRDILHGGDILIAHNSQFEAAVFAADLVGVKIDPKRWRCSMARAYAHGLPGSLDTLSAVLGLPQDQKKSKEGYDLIRLFCVPPPKNAKRGRATYETHPEQWEKFKAYCKQDIVAAREVWRRLPEWNYKSFELDLWLLDQKINQRGICIDVPLAKAAIRAVNRVQTELRERTSDLTYGEVESATQRDALLAHILASYGVALPDMQASTLERRIEDPDLPEGLRELLAIRLQATTSSTAKYKKVMACVSRDGRLRGTLQFCGAARTGRSAGRLFQPTNLARPTMPKEDIVMGIEALKADCADILYSNVMEVASNAVRGLVTAPPGKKLLVADLSNIEGRYAAWLAGEEWKLQAFRDYDTILKYDEEGKPVRKGHDLYKLSYAKAFCVKPEDVTKKQRDEIGKTMELALGFQGSVGAFVTFSTSFGINIDKLAEDIFEEILPPCSDNRLEAASTWDWAVRNKRDLGLAKRTYMVCNEIKNLWRLENPMISSMWPELQEKTREAICSPGATFTCRRLKIRRDKTWLRIVTPSGRALCYPQPRVDDDGKISFMGIDQYTRQWDRIYTFGGKLFENQVQGGARDVFMHGLMLANDNNYETVLHVYDEQIAEVPDTDDFTVAGLCEFMTTVPPWAEGLPLAAAGYESYKYRKD